jgi:hypothetical protein
VRASGTKQDQNTLDKADLVRDVSRAIHLLAGFLVMFTFLPNVAPAEEKPLATASPAQLQEEAYTKKIREYTTEPFFLTDA